MTMHRFIPGIAAGLFVLSQFATAQDSGAASADKPKAHSAGSNGNPVVIMKTSLGDITIELFQDKAPVTVKNFLEYVHSKFYDKTVFHRVIKGFMIQGGGFEASKPPRQKKTREPIINEATNGVSNARGTIAMARTSDPNSATSQFFINVADNKMLDRGMQAPGDAGYAVFGKVIDGMNVVDSIRSVKTGTSPLIARAGDKEMQQPSQDVPVEQVVILSVHERGHAGK